jgi:nucleotide-binding universal stress UspA family protein
MMRRAAAIVGSRAESRLVDGPPLQSLLHELREKQATLAMVGTRGPGRLYEIVIGGVAGELLGDAPCSVLIARRSLADAPFPHAIVVGADGSPESDRAVTAAKALVDRYGVPLRIITALKGPPRTGSRMQHQRPAISVVPRADVGRSPER